MKEVYIVLSPEGGIAINMFTSKGTVYSDKEKAEAKLKSKNEWSAVDKVYEFTKEQKQ